MRMITSTAIFLDPKLQNQSQFQLRAAAFSMWMEETAQVGATSLRVSAKCVPADSPPFNDCLRAKCSAPKVRGCYWRIKKALNISGLEIKYIKCDDMYTHA